MYSSVAYVAINTPTNELRFSSRALIVNNNICMHANVYICIYTECDRERERARERERERESVRERERDRDRGNKKNTHADKHTHIHKYILTYRTH
jgi:hypothetical protein